MAASTFSPEKYVYTIKTCAFTLAGKTYGVSSVRLMSAESSIPAAELIINPKPDANPQEVETLSLSDMLGYISEIQALANNPDGVCTLDLKMESESDSQEVKFEKWLLVDAGLSVGAKGELGCRVTMQHPIQGASISTIALLDKYYGAAAGTPAVEGADIVMCVTKGLRRYLDQHPVGGGQGEVNPEIGDKASAIDAVTLARAEAAVSLLETYVEWKYDGPGMPFEAIGAGFEEVFRYDAVSPDGYIQEGLSPYHTMMTMLDELMVATSGTFDDEPIQAFPREPWKASTMQLSESETALLQLPKAPVNTISGVAVLGPAETATYTETTDGQAGGSTATDSNIVVQGGYIDKAEFINGRLYIVNPPSFFTYFSYLEQGNLVMDDRNKGNGAIETTQGAVPGVTAAKLKWSTSMLNAVNCWAHDYFWKTYRANFAMTFRLKFMIAKDDQVIRPGIVCDLVDADGQTMYSCYIVNVTHTLDVAGRQAYTDIVGYYARGADGITDVLDAGAIEDSWVFNGQAASK